MPKTILGKVSLALIILMPVLFIVGASFSSSLYVGVPAGNSIAEDITLRPALAYTMLAANLMGVAAFTTGSIAIFAKRDRSIAVYISTGFGALLIIFLLGEVVFPH